MEEFCAQSKVIWQFIGYILTIFKIVIPLLIIIFGTISLGKAVVSSDDGEIKKAVKSLAFRIISGILIFFIPTLVGVIFLLIPGDTEIKADRAICVSCMTSPTNSKLCVDSEISTSINPNNNSNELNACIKECEDIWNTETREGLFQENGQYLQLNPRLEEGVCVCQGL